MPQTCPFHAPEKRWRDILKDDLSSLGINDGEWYDKVQDRICWRNRWSQLDYQQTAKQVLCRVCGRSFRRKCDKACHKCIAERHLPVQDQTCAIQCSSCQRWFKSKGGLAVHKCIVEHEEEPVIPQAVTYSVCQRDFRRPGDFKRHKCIPEQQKPVQDQHGAVQCEWCHRWFKSAGGLAVHKRSCTVHTEVFLLPRSREHVTLKYSVYQDQVCVCVCVCVCPAPRP